MSCPFSKDHLSQLKQFIDVCKSKPDILYHSDLAFFKEYVESLGAEIPIQKTEPASANTEEIPPMEEEVKIESEPESDLELDMEGCIEPDKLEDSQFMGVVSDTPPSEEDIDKADEKRVEAMKEFGEGNYEKAIECFTEAIKLNPTSALMFAKRGQAYLKLGKPNACIKDCTKALELNCDSAAAYKFRGRAYRLIADWEKAAKDLRQACNIDFDEQADEWLREVTPNARKLEQHKLKQERKKAEKELKEKQERVRKAREANARAATENQSTNNTGSAPAGGGMGGMNDFFQFLNDPEVMESFKDPEVAKAFQDISQNPANILKHQSNPKVAAVMAKLASKIKGGVPAGSGMPAGFPDMGNMFSGGAGMPPTGATFPTSGPTGDDVELD